MVQRGASDRSDTRTVVGCIPRAAMARMMRALALALLLVFAAVFARAQQAAPKAGEPVVTEAAEEAAAPAPPAEEAGGVGDIPEEILKMDAPEPEAAVPAAEVRKPKEDVLLAYALPKFSDKQVPSGEIVELVIGFVNNGSIPLNVTMIRGALHPSVDFSHIYQNFTRLPRSLLVQAGERVTLDYIVKPHEMFEPREYGLTVLVDYTDVNNVNYTSAAFNGTFFVVDATSGFDAQIVFTYIALAALAGLVLYGVYRFGVSRRWFAQGKGKRRAAVETGTRDAPGAASDWLEGTHASQYGGKARHRKN